MSCASRPKRRSPTCAATRPISPRTGSRPTTCTSTSPPARSPRTAPARASRWLKEKALAAQRYGIKLVIAPKLNERDCEDFPEHLRKDVEFRFLDHVEDVFELALERAGRPSRRERRRSAGMLTPAAASKTREFNGSEEDSG